MNRHEATPEHEALYQDVVEFIRKWEHLGAPTMLAVTANMLGKMVALQDQTIMSPKQAMEIVARNIEIGNAQVIAQLAASPATRA